MGIICIKSKDNFYQWVRKYQVCPELESSLKNLTFALKNIAVAMNFSKSKFSV